MTRYKNAFNKRFQRIVCQNNSAKIYSEKKLTVCNAVFFRLCVDLMHVTPTVTAEGYDDSHHPRCTECESDIDLLKFHRQHRPLLTLIFVMKNHLICTCLLVT